MYNATPSYKDFVIDNTEFIFRRNFAGDPSKSNSEFPSNERYANIVIPDEDMALEMRDLGMDVQIEKNKDDDPDFVPRYFITAYLKYRDKKGEPIKYPPKAYLVTAGTGNPPTLLDEDSAKLLDEGRVTNVQCVLHPSPKKGRPGLKAYIRVIYVTTEIANDPFACQYYN